MNRNRPLAIKFLTLSVMWWCVAASSYTAAEDIPKDLQDKIDHLKVGITRFAEIRAELGKPENLKTLSQVLIEKKLNWYREASYQKLGLCFGLIEPYYGDALDEALLNNFEVTCMNVTVEGFKVGDHIDYIKKKLGPGSMSTTDQYSSWWLYYNKGLAFGFKKTKSEIGYEQTVSAIIRYEKGYAFQYGH